MLFGTFFCHADVRRIKQAGSVGRAPGTAEPRRKRHLPSRSPAIPARRWYDFGPCLFCRIFAELKCTAK